MFEFIAYSDIHHDEYKNGITLKDTIYVEDAITEYAISHNIKNIFFLGDWFRATNPLRSVIAAAEAAWKRRNDASIYTHVLVGNHDRWTKAANSGHAFISADIFNSDLDKVSIHSWIEIKQFGECSIMFIPSGHEDIKQDNGHINIVLFHGLVAGSALANNTSVSGGIHPDILRSINASLYLGGDNHTHQRLDNLLGVNSMYLGAPLQHNWGDRDQIRGFWHIKYYDAHNIEYIHVPTNAPRFVRENIPANTEMEAIMNSISMLTQKLGDSPGIVDITLIGKNVSNFNRQIIHDSINTALNFKMRYMKIGIDQTYERLELAPGISQLSRPEEKWGAYVSAGNAPNIKDMNIPLLNSIGVWAIEEARKL